MSNIKFYRGTSIPTSTTLPDGGIYFNTYKNKIYINNNDNIIEYNGNFGKENTTGIKGYKFDRVRIATDLGENYIEFHLKYPCNAIDEADYIPSGTKMFLALTSQTIDANIFVETFIVETLATNPEYTGIVIECRSSEYTPEKILSLISTVDNGDETYSINPEYDNDYAHFLYSADPNYQHSGNVSIPDSVVIGEKNTSHGYAGVAIGYKNIVLGGLGAVALGVGNEALNKGAIAFGGQCINHGSQSICGGYKNKNYANTAVVLGSNNSNNYRTNYLISDGVSMSDLDAQFNFITGQHHAGTYAKQQELKGRFNLIAGYANGVNGNSNSIQGEFHSVTGNRNMVGGLKHIVTGDGNIVGGATVDVNTANAGVTVLGSNNIVSGRHRVEGNYNIVGGFDNEVTGIYCTVGGYNNKALTNRTTIFGYTNTVDTKNTTFGYNFVAGRNNEVCNKIAVGDNTVLGVQNYVGTKSNEISSARGNTVIGLQNTVSGEYNTVIGLHNDLNYQSYKFIFGVGHNIKEYSMVGLGTWPAAFSSALNAKKIALVLGSGSSSSARYTPFAVYQDNLGDWNLKIGDKIFGEADIGDLKPDVVYKSYKCNKNSYGYFEVPSSFKNDGYLLVFELYSSEWGSIMSKPIRYMDQNHIRIDECAVVATGSDVSTGVIRDLHLYSGVVQFYGFLNDAMNSLSPSDYGDDITNYISNQYDLYCYKLGRTSM